MYFSYITQIMGNLDGNKTPFIQTLAVANLLGIIFGLLTTITAF